VKNYTGITGGKSKYISLIFFAFGLIGALGFRIILLLNKINPIYASISWYTAIIAYLFFYGYRLYIEEKRRKMVIKDKLREKLSKEDLDQKTREKLKIILDSVLVSKFSWNLIILIILSFTALIIQIIIDLQ